MNTENKKYIDRIKRGEELDDGSKEFPGQLQALFSLCGESEFVYESNGWSENVYLTLYPLNECAALYL